MKCVEKTRVWSVVVLAGLAFAIGYTSTAIAQKTDAKSRRTPLPDHYAKVVTDAQRDEINAIQDEYAPQIEKLRSELDALRDKRDAAIEKVLTAEQRKEVEKLRADAASRRQGGNAEAAAKTDADTKSDAAAPKAKSKAKKAA